MLRMREHIHRGKALGLIAQLCQGGKVAGEGNGVAADIDHPLRGHARHAGKEFRGGALARGVHKDDVCLLPCCGRFADPAGGVGGKEAGVLYAVMPCVANGILHGVPVQLHAHHLLRMVGGGQTDGADAAVGVQHYLFAGQLRGLHRKAVQHFGLGVVDLIKAARADGVGLAAKGVQNEPLAVQHFFRFAQHHAGLAAVHVLHHGGHSHTALRCFGQQRLDKVLCARQHRLRRHQHHHHLPGGYAPPQQTVAHKSGAFVLVVGLVEAGVGGSTHRLHRLVQHLVLQQTAFHRQHLVAVCRIDAGGQFSTPAGGKGGDHLIAVVVRLLHAPDGVHRAVFAHQSPHFFFLLFQLRGIVQPQQGAAAAVFGTQFAIHGSFFLYITDTLFSGYHRAGRIATASRCVFCSFLFYRRGFTFPR